MLLTFSEVHALALEAGFSGESAVTITAIAKAESDLNTEAIGDVTLENDEWGPSIGLCQIRSLNAQKGTGGQRDEFANFDALTNLKHAFEISNNGVDFSPWTTYKTGAYAQYVPEIEKLFTQTQESSIRPVYHRVTGGETLSEIALKNHTTVAELMKLNPDITNANLIFVGQEVRVK